MGQNVVKINTQIYDVYNVNDVPMDVASLHNSQLTALHESLTSNPLTLQRNQGPQVGGVNVPRSPGQLVISSPSCGTFLLGKVGS